MSVFIILIVFVAISVGYGFVLKKFGLKGLMCSRTFSKQTAFEGEEAELVEVVINDRPMFVPWLRLESRISQNIQFGSQRNADNNGYVYHRSMFTLMPYQRVTRRHKVKFLHRGAYNIGNAALTVGDAVGMALCSRDQRMDVPVVVYPRLLDERDIPQPLSRLLGDCMVERQLLRDPFLINSVRPYRAGDPVRDSHWPATARTGEVHVRVHDFSAQTRLMVVINSQLKENQWDNLMEYEQTLIEQEISLAATLCVQALRTGLTAGFGCNMPLTGEKSCTLTLPSGGAAREEELLASFARLKILRVLNFNAVLSTLPEMSGLDIVVLSTYTSDALEEQLSLLRSRGNVVMLHVMEKGGAA